MFAFRRLRTFVRQAFRGWDRTLTRGVQAVSRSATRSAVRVWGWARARHWIYFLQGLPAIGGCVAVVVLVVLSLALPAQEVEARYQEQANAATKAKDFPKALVCHERLTSLGRDRPDNLYELALAVTAHGQSERGFEIMEQLAPLDRIGYGPAHLWLGIHYFKTHGDPKSRTRAEAHLQKALRAELPNPDPAHGLLGELYLLYGKPDLAEVHLQNAVRTRPHVRLKYAQALAAQGKKSRAADEATMAAKFFKTHAQADSANHLARIGWAESLAFLEHFDNALTILAEGFHLSNDPGYQVAMANVFAKWHLFLVQSQPEDTAKQWDVLEKALQLDTTNVAMLNRLVQLLGKGGDDTDKARTVMHKILAQGQATGTAHFLLGMDAWQRGDQAQARVHWEQANQLAPNLPIVTNNLAWLLAANKEPELPRALKLIDFVVEKYPQEAIYRSTRAFVYRKMKRWEDALTDLEWILRRAPQFPGVHAALADVYSQLNMTDLAAEHRRLEKIRKKS
jgi:tetratricopeptide (TPR) repeat protein